MPNAVAARVVSFVLPAGAFDGCEALFLSGGSFRLSSRWKQSGCKTRDRRARPDMQTKVGQGEWTNAPRKSRRRTPVHQQVPNMDVSRREQQASAGTNCDVLGQWKRGREGGGRMSMLSLYRAVLLHTRRPRLRPSKQWRRALRKGKETTAQAKAQWSELEAARRSPAVPQGVIQRCLSTAEGFGGRVWRAGVGCLFGT